MSDEQTEIEKLNKQIERLKRPILTRFDVIFFAFVVLMVIAGVYLIMDGHNWNSAGSRQGFGLSIFLVILLPSYYFGIKNVIVIK